jgi:hypothetical protein
MAVGIYAAALAGGIVTVTVCENWLLGTGCQDTTVPLQTLNHRVYNYDGPNLLSRFSGNRFLARQWIANNALQQALADQQGGASIVAIVGQELS